MAMLIFKSVSGFGCFPLLGDDLPFFEIPVHVLEQNFAVLARHCGTKISLPQV
jgi:hypothetical protein